MPTFDRNRLHPRAHPWLVAVALALIAALTSAMAEPDVGAAEAGGDFSRQTTTLATSTKSSLYPYRGFGTWIDIYDEKQWEDPGAAVRRMKKKGVQTLYLETANYRIRGPIFKPRKTARFIHASHRHGIKIVAWYLPDFKNLRRDLRRSKAAIRFKTAAGQTFDRFALDIEATVVQDVDRRNKRMFALTRKIRKIAPHMALGAIVPDPIGSLYWPNFPYAKVANRYDVMMPMGYFTYRTSGAKGVRQHVKAGIAALRRMTTADKRIHYIGGLAVDATKGEVRAYRRVVIGRKTLGGGIYDFADTRPAQWATLKPLRKLSPSGS